MIMQWKAINSFTHVTFLELHVIQTYLFGHNSETEN